MLFRTLALAGISLFCLATPALAADGWYLRLGAGLVRPGERALYGQQPEWQHSIQKCLSHYDVQGASNLNAVIAGATGHMSSAPPC